MKGKHVYVIKNEFSRVKIGVSSNLQERLGTIKKIGGSRITRIWFSEICGNALEIEKILHSEFDDERCIGEWFVSDFDNVVKVAMEQEYIDLGRLGIDGRTIDHNDAKNLEIDKDEIAEYIYDAAAFKNIKSKDWTSILKHKSVLKKTKLFNSFRYYDPLTHRMVYCKLSFITLLRWFGFLVFTCFSIISSKFKPVIYSEQFFSCRE